MNGKASRTRLSLRQILRLHLCGREAELAVLYTALGCCGFIILRAGVEIHDSLLMKAGWFCLATPCVIAWLAQDSDAADPLPEPAVQCGGIARMSDEQFDRLLDEVDQQASMPAAQPSAVAAGVPAGDEGAFAQIVRDALDELPEFVQDELRSGNLAVTTSDDGWRRNAYGLYRGGTVADGGYCHQITIYRDTLTESYGEDPEELRRQVTITVRHEIAHHFGAGEQRVQKLGL